MPALTLQTLENRVAGATNMNLGDSTEKSLIDGWINEAVEQFLVATGIRVTSATMSLTSGEGDYELPTPVVDLKRFLITDSSGSPRPCEPMSEHEMDYRRRYATVAGDTPRYFALSGSNLLQVFPTPQSALTAVMYYVPRPTAMSSPSDDPSNTTFGGIPPQFHPAIEAYGKWKAAEYDDDSSSQMGLEFKNEWEEWLKRARIRRNMMGGRLAPARAGTRARNYVTPPGVDTGR